MYHRIVTVATLALLVAATWPINAATLTAETSHPNTSTFASGEPVRIAFTATGLPTSSGSTLSVVVKGAHEEVVARASIAVAASANGTWTGEYAPPCDKLGFYRVFATLADGATIARLASRHAGYITYAIVPDPASRVDYGEQDSIFGMQGGFNETVNVIPYLGVRWVLGGYEWGRQEKDHPGQFAENFAGARAKGLPFPGKHPAQEGLKYNGKDWNTYVLPGLDGAPDWATDPSMRGVANAPILPASEGAYQSFCQAAAGAFAANYPNQKEHLYQVTWEPIYPWGFKGTDSQLLRIFELAYPALHKGDPNAVVLGPTGGGIHGDDVAWAEKLLKEGLGKNLDGFSIHPYFMLPPERNGLVDGIQHLKDIIHQYTGRDLKLYGTEQGYSCDGDVSKELIQTQGLVREYLILAGEGFRLNFAFYIADDAGDTGYGFYYNLQPGVNWGANKISPKPVAPAYAAMTYLVDGSRPTQRIDWLGPTTLGYAFQRRGDVTLALWDYGDKTREVTVPVGVDHVTVYDWMGNPHIEPSSGGALRISLGPDPIYVTGVSPTIWGKSAVKPLRVSAHRIQAFPGDPISIGAHLSAGKGGFDGTLTLALDKRLSKDDFVKPVRIASGGALDVTYETRIPADLELGVYSGTLILKDKAGRTLAGDGTRIDVRPPVFVEGVSPVVSGGHCCLAVTLGDVQSKPLSGTINTRLQGVPGGKQMGSFSIASGEVKTITLAALDADISPAKVYDTIVRVRTETGYEFEQTFKVDFLQAPKLGVAPSIDGDLKDWDQVSGVTLAGTESVVRGPRLWTGDADLSAVVKYAWDAKALYLAVDVTDDVFYQANTGFSTWQGDSLQIGIDVDNGRKAVKTGNDLEDKSAQHRWSELTLALTKNGPEVYRTNSYDTDRFKVGLVTLSDLPLAVVRKGSHTLYEASIPWRTLGKTETATAGERIGVALSVNDIDDAKQADPKAVGLFGGMNGHKQMDDYGVLTLDGAK